MMKIQENLKKRAKTLKQEITALYYAYRDPDMPAMPKLLITITLGYALSPIDLIPDFIPILGYLDDLIILPALIALSLRIIPKPIMEKARLRAESEPVKLRKNRVFAAFFIAVWLAIAVVILLSVVRVFRGIV